MILFETIKAEHRSQSTATIDLITHNQKPNGTHFATISRFQTKITYHSTTDIIGLSLRVLLLSSLTPVSSATIPDINVLANEAAVEERELNIE